MCFWTAKSGADWLKVSPEGGKENGSVTLTASGADSYLWSTGETSESITVSPTANTTYSVAGTNAYGCTDETSFEVTVVQGTAEAQEARFTVWPNPTTGVLHLEGKDIANVEVMNMLGQVVWKTEAAEAIDLSGLENGMYFLMVRDKNGLKGVTKIIKE